MTYHVCDDDPLESFKREWDRDGKYDSDTVPQIVDSIVRKALRSYHQGVVMLRDAVDALENEETGSSVSDVDRVQALTLIQKKAGVYKRCATASREALEELEAVESLAKYVKTLCDGIRTVESMTDEIVGNVMATIDLTIALSEFRSNANLKIFTYMTVLLQPITVATSWYGMNFVVMPETADENGYFYFAPCAWGFAIIFFVLFIMRETIVSWWNGTRTAGKVKARLKGSGKGADDSMVGMMAHPNQSMEVKPGAAGAAAVGGSWKKEGDGRTAVANPLESGPVRREHTEEAFRSPKEHGLEVLTLPEVLGADDSAAQRGGQ